MRTLKKRRAARRWGCLLQAWAGAVVLLSCQCAFAQTNAQTVLSGADSKLLGALERAEPSLLGVALSEGADVNRRSSDGVSPLSRLLHTAKSPLTPAQRECASLLLERGADPNCMDEQKRTLTIQAARLGDFETLRLLVEAGAYVRARDRFNKTALMYAVEGHRRDIVEYLAQNGDLQSHPYRKKPAGQLKP